jgi:cellulose biosynthesis protein BcsQ
VKIVAFFNNKGGVGKTSLVYHLAWMFSDLGLRVVAVDLDPQANLTAAFLDEERLEAFWPEAGDHVRTVLGAIQPVIRGTGDLAEPHVEAIAPRLGLVVGDVGLSSFEDRLSRTWPECVDRQEHAFRVTSVFYRIMRRAALASEAEVVLLDVGPNLGAINRAAIVGADHIVVPLAPDLFSIQGLKNLGPTLRHWREEWKERRDRCPTKELDLPPGDFAPAGYVVLQHAVRLDRPVKAYERWLAAIPAHYRADVLGKAVVRPPAASDDPYCLAMLKHYRSLMPLAQAAGKPMFHLKAADGALGSHAQAVTACYQDFRALALRVAETCRIAVPGVQSTLFRS